MHLFVWTVRFSLDYERHGRRLHRSERWKGRWTSLRVSFLVFFHEPWSQHSLYFRHWQIYDPLDTLTLHNVAPSVFPHAKWMREAELKHCRAAMLATVGLWSPAGSPDVLMIYTFVTNHNNVLIILKHYRTTNSRIYSCHFRGTSREFE